MHPARGLPSGPRCATPCPASSSFQSTKTKSYLSGSCLTTPRRRRLIVCSAAARHSSKTTARQLLFEGIVAVDCVPCTPCICHMIYIWDMFTGPIRIPLQTPEYSGFDVCVESMRNTDIRLLNTSVSHAHNTQTHTIQPSKRGTRSQIEFPTL